MESFVYQGETKNGIRYVIRYPNENDAEKMCLYINTLSREKTFIRYQGEVVTLDQEGSFLNNQLNKIKNNQAVMLLIEADGRLLGISGVEMRDKAERITGEFGISILNEIRGEGIGKLLMELVLREAAEGLHGLKIITLSVFGNNSKARKMYEKFGFKEYGILPDGVLHQGKEVDHIFMYKSVKEI
ncbi:MAG: GNAT family protein [Patescibacteria group bacterium]